jgi:UDP-glucose 4-epimerase
MEAETRYRVNQAEENTKQEQSMGRKILVTGGAGFIGSHVADRMLEIGHEVTVVDDLSTGVRSNVPGAAEFIELDIRDAGRVENLFSEHRFDAMLHLAAQMDVRRSVADAVFDAEVNIFGLLNLLNAGEKYGLKRVIFSSTGGAGYDDDVPFPTPESEPANPVSPYGITKNTSERYLRFFGREHGLGWCALRLGNIYGPRQNPHGEAGVIAIFTRKLLDGGVPRINGDGLQTRDYVYVSDVVKAFELALESDVNDFFNIGTAKETSVVELYNQILKAAELHVKAEKGPPAAGEVRRSCLANDKAKEILGWSPEVSMAEGIRATVEFFRRQQQKPDVR